MAKKITENSWDQSENWYSSIVGEKGHHYHQSIVIPGVLRLLGQKTGSLLDLGCGQGVLCRHLPQTIEYWGVDNSKNLIASAKRMAKGNFILASATENLPIEKKDFDAACFVLSLQNMENGEGAIASAANHLKKGGRLLIVLNHPCFRIPRQSNWGFDSHTQYRKINSYLSPQKIPIQTHPSKGTSSPVTYSYHHPLSDYAKWLNKHGFLIRTIEEWCSDKKSEGSRARMEDRARKEIPLFMALCAVYSDI